MSDEMQVVEHHDSIMKVQRENATWVGVVDIYEHAPLKMRIKKVVKTTNATFEGGRKENKQCLQFEGTSKMLPLNATNTKYLWEHVGKTADDLAGKTIMLCVEELDRPYRGQTHGVRIRAVSADPQSA